MEQSIVTKFFELTQLVSQKAELGLKIAECFALDRAGDVRRDLSLHRRDDHRGHFNVEYYLKCQREYREEMEQLRAQYRELCEQIKALEAEIGEHLSVRV